MTPSILLQRITQAGRNALARLVLFVLWCLHVLPLPCLRAVGYVLGVLLFRFASARRYVALVNLAACFPDKAPAEREALLRQHFVFFAQSLLDRALFWWASRERLSRLIVVYGQEYLLRGDGVPTLLLAPHFAGLDAGGVAIAMRTPGVSVYSRQKNQPVFDEMLRKGRQRFNDVILISRTEGIRRAIRAMKAGRPFYYLPDMDLGSRDSIFVPFFGVPAATVPGLSKMARATGAKVVPVIARMTSAGYRVDILPPWENFPGESVEADTAFMNRFIEEHVRKMPAEYHWLHKRFKTRPQGEAALYE
jgi:KDO2-lipid IV(A) lauroyltransferase